MRFTKKEWRILERALLKFSYTDDDEGNAFETNAEINDLYAKVYGHRREHKRLLFPGETDERKRTPAESSSS